MQHLLSSSFSSIIPVHQYPHSTISISLHVLALDGGLLAALVNATTLALIDAGIPMLDYLVACTAGSTLSQRSTESTNRPSRLPGLSVPSVDVDDPLLDLNGLEEQDLPFLTVATLGGDPSKVSALVLETRMSTARLDDMLSAALDGCKSIKKILDSVVREHGKNTLSAD
jgi:exosome complex component RRP41